MVVRDLAPGSSRSLAATTPTFNMVGLHWQGSGTPSFRVRSATGWSAWEPADDDWGRSGAWRKSNAVWTGTANAIQVRPGKHVSRVREYLLWSPPVNVPERHVQAAGAPAIITRSGWDADEKIRRAPPTYAPVLQFALVHHTASTNAYSCAQSASIVRGIETYHVKGNGWNDIGYNFLVDSCGQIFEGRYGGADKNVVGAHSQGFNTGSVGVAMLGTYGTAKPTAAEQTGLVNLLAWRLDVAHIDPLSFVGYVSGGNSKVPAGIPVSLRTVSGHRDTYFTDCPGNALYKLIPSLAQRVATTGGPKLYAPRVTGSLGGPIRFTGRFSTALPWTVTVLDPTGGVAASTTGTGTSVDWTWDSKTAIPGAAYTWTIAAGTGVRPASGTLGGKLAALTVTKLQVSPPLIDGMTTPSATGSYTLSVPATGTADELTADGVLRTSLFSEAKTAGDQSFVLTVSDLPDDNYAIRITARDALGRQTQATAPFTVSRTLLEFGADTRIVSPNGDGRHDSATYTVRLAQASTITLLLTASRVTTPIKSVTVPSGVQSVTFDGHAADGGLVDDGVYNASVLVETPMENSVTQSTPLIVDTKAPALALVSLSPLRLKTDGAVTVLARFNGRHLKTTAKAGTFRLGPREPIRTLYVVVRDAAGNESPPVRFVAKR
jgi:hypothetical protein